MRHDLTDVTVVLDRSGSMQVCRTDAEGGLNAFIEDQKKEAGECKFTLVQFDSLWEIVHECVDIRDVPHCDLRPGGATALLDAVGTAIARTGDRLAKMDEEDRPGLVIFVIITDGEENASREYTLGQVKAMITHQQEKYGWKFTFLGANQDAFASGASMGISHMSSATYRTQKTAQTFAAMSASVGRARSMAGSCGPRGPVGPGSVDLTYTSDERAAMGDGDEPPNEPAGPTPSSASQDA